MKRTPFQRAEFRLERLLRDREAIRVLRQHFTGYEVRDGYSLDIKKIAAMPYWQRRALRKKYTKVATLLSQLYDEVTPRSPQDAKALRHFTGERFQRMKHFIVQKPDKDYKVTLEKGAVTLQRKFARGVAFKEQFFFFPKRARGHESMIKMLRSMLKQMPEGFYFLQTRNIPDIGTPVDKGQLERRLREYLADYDKPKYGEHRFMNQVTGFRFASTKIEGAEVQQASRDERRAGQREYNRKFREQLKREAEMRARREIKK